MYSKILVALDGSGPSSAGAEIALLLAQKLGCTIVATHIYDARIHSSRFREMEPVLPGRYQEEERLTQLRESHKGLINEGFAALSKGYMEQFLEEAGKAAIPVIQVHKEGRNYVELMKVAEEQQVNLIVAGAAGLGNTEPGRLGSTALRILRLARCDVLISRKSMGSRGVVAGIDGSEEALDALRKAASWANLLSAPLRLVAAYDPHFHTQVFKTMGESLSAERRAQVNLTSQETLHEEIIDDGLGKLYEAFLEQAQERSAKWGANGTVQLVKGKAYISLAGESRDETDLLVVGRYGHHRQDVVPLGSNSETAAALAGTNVLVASAVENRGEVKVQEVEWDSDALARLERVPPFARPMARQAVEGYVRAKGETRVSLAVFTEVASRFGMGGGKPEGE
jgi:nucleotide-binding universal stress UspA family protein